MEQLKLNNFEENRIHTSVSIWEIVEEYLECQILEAMHLARKDIESEISKNNFASLDDLREENTEEDKIKLEELRKSISGSLSNQLNTRLTEIFVNWYERFANANLMVLIDWYLDNFEDTYWIRLELSSEIDSILETNI